MKSIVLPLLLTLMLSLSCTSQASNMASNKTSNQNGSEISKQQAISAAQQANPGRVLAIERHNNTYRVKMLNADGEVRIILIDASSGKLLRKR